MTGRLAGVTLAALLVPLAARADCQMNEVLDLPIGVVGRYLVADVEINGARAKLVVCNTGCANSLTLDATKKYGLKISLAAAQDVSGQRMADVKDLKIGTAQFRDTVFEVDGQSGAGDGVIGEGLFNAADVDFDVAGGSMKLMRPKDCGDQPLAYWLSPGETFAELPFSEGNAGYQVVIGIVSINGVQVKALFQTCATTSILSLSAAKRAGLTPDEPGTIEGGVIGGVGNGKHRIWIVPVKSLEIGGEVIRNTRLRIGELGGPDMFAGAEMILGVDFFRSHHVYIANSQHKLYLTYNGGPVFDLTARPVDPKAK